MVKGYTRFSSASDSIGMPNLFSKKSTAANIRRKYEPPSVLNLLLSRSFWKEEIEFLKKGLPTHMLPLIMTLTEFFK